MSAIQNRGIFLTLVAQLDRLARHNRQGSFRTKARYYEACKRFCAYLAAEYHLQKLENISGKHLVSYVLYLQDTGKSASTVKTDLAAIRFFHDKMSRPKYTLPTNSELGVELERRRFGQLDRTWSGPEFNRLLGKAMAENRDDFILALYLGRYAGFRIHECFRMDTAAAEQALRENALTVKGQGRQGAHRPHRGRAYPNDVEESVGTDRAWSQAAGARRYAYRPRHQRLGTVHLPLPERGQRQRLRPALVLSRASAHLCCGAVYKADGGRHERH